MAADDPARGSLGRRLTNEQIDSGTRQQTPVGFDEGAGRRKIEDPRQAPTSEAHPLDPSLCGR